jgi:ketosteroid isomerase-like protein
MRPITSLALAGAIALGLAGGLLAQEQPATDMKDPSAVAQAYAKACREHDVKAVLGLLAPDEPGRASVEQMLGQMSAEREQGLDMVAFFREFLFLPVGFEGEQAFGEATQEGDRAQVKLTVTSQIALTYVLARQPDGTWRVRLVDSLRASAPGGNSQLARQLSPETGPRGDMSEPWRTQQNLYQLLRAMQEYTQDHQNRLPAADRWVDELEPYVLDRSLFRCPAVPDAECGYAINDDVAGKALPQEWDERENIVTLFPWPAGGRNAHASAKDVSQLKSPLPDGTLLLGMASGRVLMLQPGETLIDRADAERLARTCQEHLRALVDAARRYARAHDGTLPAAGTWETDIAPYVQVQTVARPPNQDRWQSQNRIQRLYSAFQEYFRDHDSKFPPPEKWMDEIEPYLLDEDALKCPAAPNLEYGYAMNEDLAGQALPPGGPERRRTLVLFEWPSGERNAHAPQAALAAVKSLRADGVVVAVSAEGQGVAIPPGLTYDEMVDAEGHNQTCQANLRRLADAARKFARDHDGVLPSAESWQADLTPYLLDERDANTLLICPAVPELDYAYALNQEVAGKKLADFRGRGQTVLFFESDLNVPNACGVPDPNLAGKRRHLSYWSAPEGRFDNLVYTNGIFGESPRQPLAAPEGADVTEGPMAAALTCPAVAGVKHAYAINAAIAGKRATELTGHDRIVLFFESDLDAPNAAGDPAKDASARGRHAPYSGQGPRCNHVGYLAGATGQIPVGPAGPGPERE